MMLCDLLFFCYSSLLEDIYRFCQVFIFIFLIQFKNITL
ncbi:hypothetical protein NTHI1209_01463 [Haemophilus influenzae]|uniref:Uncharacterized protein n=1 Tax=Haemophilus influenzae TaxID=727 RepID=A0A158SYA6_HAEIF|nr:hypothetical protein NTHI1209_01463 [Haemophilus influenzae]